jgi:2-keto-4-pentenoate hydratase/2-oxohepta-3-ene-1,7-dioic acid hydratase in catechol pathway
VRLARLHHQDRVVLARIEDDKAIPLAVEGAEPTADVLRSALAAGIDLATSSIGAPVSLAEATLLAPVRNPQKVLAIGLNYADHARESGVEPPPAPVMFVKTPNSIVGPDEPIRWVEGASSQVDYEAELAVVIGRRATRVSRDEALDYALGYTCCNDVSARDAQFADGQWVRGKSFDTFCPVGPWIVTTADIPDPQALSIRCIVNGTALQDSTTAEMIFGVAEIISYLSRFITLEPGDVIATGTPVGVGFARDPQIFLGDGDVVDVEIEGIGTLRNPVVVEHA